MPGSPSLAIPQMIASAPADSSTTAYTPATAAGQETAQANHVGTALSTPAKKSTTGTWLVLGALAAGLALFA